MVLAVRRYMVRLGTLAGVIGVTLAVLEIFLRIAHAWVLPVSLSNEIATGYHAGWTGIYEWSPGDHMFRMRPHFSREMFFNGYSWEHQTDSRGLRHPREIESAPVVLLGDSMIYGHGVEQDDTVREQLERILRVPIANLGVQAGSMHHEYQLLQNPGLSFDPRLAILFFLKNDPYDLTLWFSEEEMVKLITAPRDPLEVQYFTPRPRSSREWLSEKLSGFYTVRAYRTLRHFLKKNLAGPSEAHASGADIWLNDQESLAMAAHNELLRRLNRLARQNDIVLLHVFIDTGYKPRRERVFKKILNNVCEEEGIPFLDLGPVFEAARASGIDPFLPGDGHFSAAGARIVAETLALWIRERGIDLGPRLDLGDLR